MFHRLSRLAAAALVCLPLIAAAEGPTLQVTIVGADPATGTVEISLFNSEEDFLKNAYLQQRCEPAEDGSCTVRFTLIKDSDCAIVAVHDANDNKKLDNGFLGFGAESFAYSNGASNPLFGRASFDDAKITVSGEMEIEIDLD